MSSERLVQYRIVATHDRQPMFTWAAWRVLDAADRLNQLEELVTDAAARWSAHVYPRARADDVAGTVTLDFAGVQTELSELARLATPLASEVLHHSRVALDYCAHHAAWRDSGEPNEWTQFPLATTATEWRKQANRWLAGVSAEHVAWIGTVQPYMGVEWSAELKRLSNHDKHRVAIQILPAYQLTVDTLVETTDPLGDDNFVGLSVPERIVDILIGDAFGTKEPEPMVEAFPLLWAIVRGVTDVVNKFLVSEGNNPIVITPVKSQSASPTE